MSARVGPTAHAREVGLDVLRAMAITAVLAFHSLDCVPCTPSAAAKFFRHGWLGVDLFFVLSGFLISRQVFRERAHRDVGAALKVFWTRRWFRTLPLYFLILFVNSVVKPALFHAPFRGDVW